MAACPHFPLPYARAPICPYDSPGGSDLRHEDDVLAANERFYQAFNQKDAELMSMLWADKHGVSCVHPG